MRLLDDALLAAQKENTLDPAFKITLTRSTDTVIYTGGIPTIGGSLGQSRIKTLSHLEEPYRYRAEATLGNSDGELTDRDLKGYQAVISYGLVTAEGTKYSDTAPLTVRAQQLNSSGGNLSCELIMVGIPDMLAEDTASEDYYPHIDSETEQYVPSTAANRTVKDLLTYIITASSSFPAFSHCKAYEIVWGDVDDLMNTYKPKEGLRVYAGGRRLAAIRRLLDFTRCVMRIDNDGKINIFQPVITGAEYDYEYALEGEHPFLGKAYRKTLVIPNSISVKSRKDDDPQYSGTAKDKESINAYWGGEVIKYIRTRLESNQQASRIAEAVLGKYQLNAEMGAAEALMNCGAELFDYVKVTDAREDDYRIGNLGSIKRTFNASESVYNMRFSFGGWLTVRGLASDLEVYPDGIQKNYEEYIYAQYIYAEMLDAEFLSAISANMGQLTVGEILIGTGVLQPTGTATGGSNTTLEDSGASWNPNGWNGESIRIIIGGVAYTRTIIDNDATKIVFEDLPEGVEVSSGDSYYLGKIYVQSGDSYWLRGSGSGTATGGGNTYLLDTTKDWEYDAFVDKQVRIIKDGNWYQRKVTSNTSTRLNFKALPDYVPFTGFRLWTDGVLGRIAGFEDGIMQFYTGSDGKLYAGGGSIKIDSEGMTITAGTHLDEWCGWFYFKHGNYQSTITQLNKDLVIDPHGTDGAVIIRNNLIIPLEAA